MVTVNRRAFVAAAAAIGAQLVWPRQARARRRGWVERRDLYPEGVASGDPEPDSVILWTRRLSPDGRDVALTVEISTDPDFRQIVSAAGVRALAASDGTCRVLAAGLRARTVYWYRFTDAEGNGSRVGRTMTAPAHSDVTSVRFAFVSCQSVNEGWQNAWRRMIWEDERAAPDRRLDFVLHLGDFIYEVVQYPDETPRRFDRAVNDIGRVPNSRKAGSWHVPTDLAGYRFVYRAYLADADIQDARARFPFVCIGDNHEFSVAGWQSFTKYGGKVEPAQTLRVAANQAWWEYIPSRVAKASGPGLDRFDPPSVRDAAIENFDSDGLGIEPNNLAAIGSMTAYRSFRFGRNVDLIVTDHHSYTSDDPSNRPEAAPFNLPEFAGMVPEEVMHVLDAGAAYNGGRPPDSIQFNGQEVTNFRRNEPPITLLGAAQKQWWKDQLARSKARWKIWAASNGTLDWRADPMNLPTGLTRAWPGRGYACAGGGGDLGAMYVERDELYGFVQERGIEGFVTVSGDRHSFWAGYAAARLPPAKFEPVGVAFITGSLSAAGLAEIYEHRMAEHPLRALFTADRADGSHETTANLMLRHGVRTALEYAKSGDRGSALALANPDNAPHLAFVDLGGHGYAVVTAGPEALETEFVCIPRPIVRSAAPDGGPIRYRVSHRVDRWKAGERMSLEQKVSYGDPFPS